MRNLPISASHLVALVILIAGVAVAGLFLGRPSEDQSKIVVPEEQLVVEPGCEIDSGISAEMRQEICPQFGDDLRPLGPMSEPDSVRSRLFSPDWPPSAPMWEEILPPEPGGWPVDTSGPALQGDENGPPLHEY